MTGYAEPATREARFGHNGGMSAAPVDIVVIGGGPAGAAAARLLAAWGHSVQVLAKPADDARTLGESLPPSCRKLFDLIGVTGDVEAAGFLSSTGNTVWWGGRDPRAVRFAGGGIGWQVRRSELDPLLLRLASQAGAAVETDAVVRQVDLAPPSDPAGAAESSTRYLAGGDARSLRAGFVLDCSGRAGVIARRGFRRHAAGRTTLALTAVWSRPGGWGLPDESHTLVESYGDGWAWSVPVTAERRYFTLMVDPRVTRLERGGPLAPCYEAELAKTAALGPLTAGAALDVEPWGCDASVYDAHAYRAPGMLLVGDAGSFIDPLSSYGVKKALASGWLAAVVVHTALTDPALAGVALDLFDEREREMHAALERQSAEFFAEAAGRHDHPFWTDRAEAGMPEAAPLAPPEPAIDALRRDPGVLTAFEALRRAPVLRLRRGDRLGVVRRPAITARRIILEDRLVVSGWPDAGADRGLRFLRDIDLVRVVELAPLHRQVPDLYEAYNRVCPPVPLPDFLGVLSVLIAKGALQEGGDPSPA